MIFWLKLAVGLCLVFGEKWLVEPCSLDGGCSSFVTLASMPLSYINLLRKKKTNFLKKL